MTAFHVMSGTGEAFQRPTVYKISVADVFDALKSGFDDFREKPSHYVFLCLMYPVAGIVLFAWSSGANLLPLVFPMMTGFALIGPVAAIGLYEISRRREQGMDTSWRHALEVRHSPAMPAVIVVGLMLFIVFIAWLLTAQNIYVRQFGDVAPSSLMVFASNVLTTPAGHAMMVWGDVTGFVFAAVVLATTVVTFPMLLDRDCGAVSAIDTSIRATFTNPLPVAMWGLIVAIFLFIGMLPFFAGLAVVLPILGHATWHLYRKLVAPQQS